jgi:hypothetical protein
MATMRMSEAKILIPLRRDDNGEFHKPDVISNWRDMLISTFGGVTLGRAVRGAWKDSAGQTVWDDSVPCYVCYGPEHGDDTIRRLARRACTDFAQQCVYVKFGDGHVELVRK